MSPRVVTQAELVLVAADADGFSRVVRSSDFASRFGLNVVPIQYLDEALEAVQNARRILLVFDSKMKFDRAQEELIHFALCRGAHWCSVNFFEGIHRGFARVHALPDILEWLHLKELSILGRVRERLLCGLRRAVALCGLTVLMPLLLLIAAVIWFVSPGPVLYRQKRLGHKGKPFTLIKFRTMRLDSEHAGPQWSTGNTDPRVFAFGRFLRKTHLDELPQLWNVVKGDLCFVGPRPERPEFYHRLKEPIPHFFLRARVIPGITGWAQLRSGYAASVEESRRKFEFDLYFMRAVGPGFVFRIVLGTAKKCLREVMTALFSKLDQDDRSNI